MARLTPKRMFLARSTTAQFIPEQQKKRENHFLRTGEKSAIGYSVSIQSEALAGWLG